MAIILGFFLSKKEYEKVSKKGGCYVNIIIYDDSEKDRARLKKLIRQYEPKLEKNIVITEYSSGERGDLDDLIADIHQNMQELLYRFVEGEKRLRIEDIMYIETSRHKNLFHTTDGVYSIYKKLSEIEEDLTDFGFLRIHQSFLVNMRYIQKISSYVLTLKNGKELSIPKSRYQEVKKQYANHLDLSGKWCSLD